MKLLGQYNIDNCNVSNVRDPRITLDKIILTCLLIKGDENAFFYKNNNN